MPSVWSFSVFFFFVLFLVLAVVALLNGQIGSVLLFGALSWFFSKVPSR